MDIYRPGFFEKPGLFQLLVSFADITPALQNSNTPKL
jgi:hypothetical protein